MWQMSHTVSVLRMSVISLFAIGALTFWLIYHNGLWNRWPDREPDSVSRWRARMDNRATLGTVLLAAMMISATVWVVLLVLSVVIVDTNYFRMQVKDDPFPWGYAKLAWLTASLGTLAGAVGSSFDSDDSIREATYNRREHQRRQITGSTRTSRRRGGGHAGVRTEGAWTGATWRTGEGPRPVTPPSTGVRRRVSYRTAAPGMGAGRREPPALRGAGRAVLRLFRLSGSGHGPGDRGN